jgi:carbamoyl-phosphate synthase large subunit
MTDRFTVLISSAGRRVALLQIFRRTLEEMGLDGRVLAADRSTMSSAVHVADRAFVVPPCSSPEFIPQMLEICRDHDVRLVIPTIDPELPAYAMAREEFGRAGVGVAISSSDVVAIAGDKVMTHAWLEDNGFPTVGQAGIEQVLDGTVDWSYPLIAKPRRGSGSVGVRVVSTPAELQAATREGDHVVQTIATGVEYTLDILAGSDGRAACVVPRRRLEVRAGESSKGVTVRHASLQELAAKLCEALPGAHGPLTLQAIVDDGRIDVIELNPRFGGGYPLAWEAGARYPQWMIEDARGLPSTAAFDAWRDGLVMLRYDEAVFVDAEAAGL